jgi:hypothetical protein
MRIFCVARRSGAVCGRRLILMVTAWTKAGMGALKKLEGARHSLQAAGQGRRNSDEALGALYQEVRGDPRALQAWASAHVGPERAAEEGERFLLTMRRRYGE